MPKSDTLINSFRAGLILKVSTRTVARWADAGDLPVATMTEGGQRRFRLRDVERLAAKRAKERAA